MKLQNQPFWFKYRPNSLEKGPGKIPLILLPRIKKLVEKELSMNLLLYGCGGVGKTCLSEILTQDTDCLRINASTDRGIDVIRENIADHCTKYSLLGGNKTKTVFLDEFDGTTPLMRDALRGFIESQPHVRFIATVNNLSKINRSEQDQALLSRFNLICCEPLDEKERSFLINNQIGFLKGIAKKENLEIEEDILQKIVNSNFPNFRLSVQHLQELVLTGGDYTAFQEIIQERNQEIFQFILNQKNDITENFSLVLDHYKEKTDELLKMLSRPFFVYLMTEHPDLVLKKGQMILKLSKEYNAEYFNTLDPNVHLISYITELKELFKN